MAATNPSPGRVIVAICRAPDSFSKDFKRKVHATSMSRLGFTESKKNSSLGDQNAEVFDVVPRDNASSQCKLVSLILMDPLSQSGAEWFLEVLRKLQKGCISAADLRSGHWNTTSSTPTDPLQPAELFFLLYDQQEIDPRQGFLSRWWNWVDPHLNLVMISSFFSSGALKPENTFLVIDCLPSDLEALKSSIATYTAFEPLKSHILSISSVL